MLVAGVDDARNQTLIISIIIYFVSDFIDLRLPTIHNGW